MMRREGSGAKDDSRTNKASPTHQIRAQASDDSIEGPQIRGPHPRSIEDQELMFEQQRLGNDGTSAIRWQESGDGRNKMNK